MLKNALWSLFWALAIIAFLMFAWVSFSSVLILRPISWSFDKATGYVTFQRELNWPQTFSAKWAHTIYVTDPPPGVPVSCSDDGVALYEPFEMIGYQKIEVVQARYKLSEELAECARQPKTVSVLSWSVLLFGVIPLRPVLLVLPEGATAP